MKARKTNNCAQLSDAAKAARAAYTRKYRQEHPEKVRQWNKNFWERRAAEMKKNDSEQGGDNDCS